MKFRPKKFLPARIPAKVFRVSFREERALVMVKPPRQAVAGGILKIDDGVLIAVENTLIKELTGPVHHPRVIKMRLGINAGAIETREHGGRTGAIKTLIVKANADSHLLFSGHARRKTFIRASSCQLRRISGAKTTKGHRPAPSKTFPDCPRRFACGTC